MDLRRQFAVFRSWFPLLIACVLIAGAAAFVISSLLPKTYEAKSTLIVGQSLSAANPDYNQILVSQRLSSTYATVVTTRPILEAVIRQLDLDVTPDQLALQVRATVPPDSTLLTIAVQDGDPTNATRIANAIAAELVADSPGIQGRQAEIQEFIDAGLKATQSQIDTTQAEMNVLNALPKRTPAQDAALLALEDRLVSLRASFATLLSSYSGSAANLVTVIEPAVAPVSPISPRTLLNTLVAAVLGLLFALGIIIVAEHLYDGIRDSEAVSEVTGLSTLGTIARMKGDKDRNEIYRLATILHPRSAIAEAYRTLRTNVEFSSVDAPVRTILVTSAVAGEGKTVTAANLAVVFAQAGLRVLLVDADLRKPGIHRVFDLDNAHGLTTLLRSDGVSLDALTQTTEQANLRILTSGPLPPNPAELTASQRMRSLLERMTGSDELVIFDSPPLQGVTDSAILSTLVDGTLFVIDVDRSRRRAVRQALESLAKADALILGAVLNRVPVRSLSDDASFYGDSFETVETGERTRADLPPARTS